MAVEGARVLGASVVGVGVGAQVSPDADGTGIVGLGVGMAVLGIAVLGVRELHSKPVGLSEPVRMCVRRSVFVCVRKFVHMIKRAGVEAGEIV